MSHQELGVVSPPEAIQMEGQSESSRRSEAQKRWWRTHPQAEERKAKMREQWQDPKYRARMLRAKEVRRNMREANPRLLTPTAPGDLENWAYARIHNLIPEMIATGRVKEEEIERLKAFFEVKGTKDRLPKKLLDSFSIAVAWVA